MSQESEPKSVCGVDEEREDFRLQIRRMRTLRLADIKYLFMQLFDDWFRHRVPRLGASLAFYTVLSLAPLLVVIVAIADLAFSREAATGQLVWQIRELVGYDAAVVIQGLLNQTHSPAAGGLATMVGLVTLFFGASAVVAELRDALNTVWDVPDKTGEMGWRSVLDTLRERTLAFAIVLAFGFLLLVSLALNAAIAAAAAYFNPSLPLPPWVLQVINTLLTLIVITVLFAMMFKYLPDIHVAWSDVVIGAIGTAVLFTLGKTLIGIYLGNAGVGSAYGAAGSLVIILVWVYYSAQIFFLGAEFTHAYANCFGSKPKQRDDRTRQLHIASGERPDVKIELPGEPRPTDLIV